MDDLISREAAIKAIHERAGIDGFIDVPQEYVTDAIRALPSVQPEVTEEAVKDYCRKRCLTILTNDYFYKLLSAQPNLQPTCNQLATDTISRQAVIDALQAGADGFKYHWDRLGSEESFGGYSALLSAINEIERLPSAQPEIIRCKDCKHVQEDKLYGQCWCNGSEVKTDDFCSRAERREG